MTRPAHALLIAAIAALLGPFAFPEGADVRDAGATPVALSVPVEQGAYPVTPTPQTLLPKCAVERVPGAAPTPPPAEPPRAQSVVVSCGRVQAATPGGSPLRLLHPSRGPPQLS